jgi:cbb3-type cytochrome oxidase subunit 3
MWTITREEDLSRQRAVRSVMVGNGLIIAVAGALMTVALLALAISEVGTDGWQVLLTWQLWALLATFGTFGAVGAWMFRRGRRRILQPNYRIPARDELPPDHPRNRLTLFQRQERSLATSAVWVGGTALSVWLALGPLGDAGDWIRFGLFFVIPGLLMLSTGAVHARLTGEHGWPRD